MADSRFTLRPDNSAVIVHDMENGFWKAPYADPSSAAAMIPRIQRLVAVARERGVPIIYTRVSYGPQNFETSAFKRRRAPVPPDRLLEGTHGTEIVDELKPEPNDLVVTKIRYSAFYETGLERKLRTLGAEHLVMTGGSLNWGVEALARDAEYRDFIPIVLSDCTASTAPHLQQASLENIELFIGYVSTSDEIIAQLQGT
jgi:ureidoacrylate peracid hydrolase